MLIRPDFEEARNLLLSVINPIDSESCPLSLAGGRVLAEDFLARENVPAFEKSPYDGYALRAEDTISATEDNPAELKIIEEIAAGSTPQKQIFSGTAAKILTGAPIPDGADTVIMYEKTEFTDSTVKIFSPLNKGDNIIHIGEDTKKGDILARKGSRIDAGLAGSLAAQGIINPIVYKRPRVGLLTTGSEIVSADTVPEAGKIRDSASYMLSAALSQIGCEPVSYGIAGDNVSDISEMINRAVSECDALIITGGVSAGDYDLTPAAMINSGVEILFKGAAIKPGMACAYGVIGGKPVCGISGNPVSALTNFYVIASPALRKLSGISEYIPEEIEFTVMNDYPKKSPVTRILKGRLEFQGSNVYINIPKDQGNAQLGSTIGCNAIAVVPQGTENIKAGDKLKGFIL